MDEWSVQAFFIFLGRIHGSYNFIDGCFCRWNMGVLDIAADAGRF
jgi:hypothetical protein